MNPTLPPKPKRTLLIGVAVLVLAAAGGAAWWLRRAPVPPEDVEAFLNRTVGGGHFRFSAEHVGTVRQGEADLQLTVAATAHAIVPLYTRLDTAAVLAKAYPLDPALVAEGHRAMAIQGHDPAADGVGAAPPDPFLSSLLRPESPVDATFSYQAVIQAHRSAGVWDLTPVSGSFDRGSPVGDARSAFPAPTFVVGDAADEARLRGAVTDFQTYSQRALAAHQSRDAAHAALVEAHRKAFLDLLSQGRMFRGVGREAGDQRGTPLFLEIVDLAPDNGITALLRNDGGWQKARTFQGTWSADEAFDHPLLTLTSLPDQAVRNAGPFLENAQSWTLALAADSRGNLSEHGAVFQYQFQPVDPEQVAEIRGHLDAEFTQALGASEPGLLYHGTVIARESGATEPVLLRFTGRADEETLDAVLESTAHSWKRHFHGTLLSNARRSGGEPIRLRSGAEEAAADAPPDSALGAKADLEVRLGITDGALVGEDATFTYQLGAASAEDRRRLEAERKERAHALLQVLRPGMVLDGVLHEEQGFVTQDRLEISAVVGQPDGIAARIHSLTQINVYREFFGGLDPSGDSIVLTATSHGSADKSGEFDVPFLVSPAPSKVRLRLGPASVTGTIEGDPHWTMDFPTNTFLNEPTEPLGPESAHANGTIFPTFPKAGGAYLLSHGEWVALPSNNAHEVVETLKPKSAFELPTNIIDLVEQGMSEMDRQSKKVKVTYLTFDGKNPVPEANGPSIVILYAGPLPAGHPPIEIAAAQASKDGIRKAAVSGGKAEHMHFGEERLAAYVRQVEPGYELLTTTAPLSPGPYAVIAGTGFEVVQK
jgi:hypothetical protein